MSVTRVCLILGSVAALTVTLGLLLFSGGESIPDKGGLRASRRSWRPGVYEVEISMRSKGSGADASLRLQGRVELDRSIGSRLRAQLDEGMLVVTSSRAEKTLALSSRAMERVGSEVYLDASEGPEDEILLGLVAALSFPRADGEGIAPLGRARVVWNEDGRRMQRVYVGLHPWQSREVIPQTVASEVVLMTADGTLVGSRESETIRWVPPLGDQPVEVSWTLRLDRVAQGTGRALDPIARSDRRVEHRRGEALVREAGYARAKGLKWQEVRAFLRVVAHNGMSGAYMVRSAGLLEAEPQLIAELEDLYFEHRRRTYSRRFVVDLLANTNRAEAQAVLWKIYDRLPQDAEIERRFILESLALVDAPTPLTFERVLAEVGAPSERLRSTAALSAGALGARTPERAEEVREVLTLRLGEIQPGPETSAERRNIVAGLGNLRRDSILPTLTEILKSEDKEARRAATYALRGVPSAKALQLLRKTTKDRDPRVRSESFAALEQRADAGEEEFSKVFESVSEMGLPVEGRVSALAVLARSEDPATQSKVLDYIASTVLRPKERERIRAAYRRTRR